MAISPSQVSTYAFCPRKWALQHQGWIPKAVGYKDICAVLGRGFAKFTESYNRRIPDPSGIAEHYTAEALTTLLHTPGITLTDTRGEDLYANWQTTLKRACTLYIEKDPLKEYKIVQVEQPLGEDDSGRPDVVVEDTHGVVFPVDYKLKIKLEARWINPVRVSYETSWQMYHYAAGLHAPLFGIVLVVLSPKPLVSLELYPVDPKFLALWKQDAALWWNEIAQSPVDPLQVRGNITHEDKYGPCPYYSACCIYGLNTESMRAEYLQVQKGGS